MSVVVSTEPSDVGARGVGNSSRWSTRAEWFDWSVLSATILLALITIWVGSSIVRGTWDLLTVSMLWGAVGVAWSVTVLMRTTDHVARFAVWALLVGSLLTLFVIGPVVILIFSAWVVIGLLVVVPVGLLLVRQRPIRLMWLVGPGIVVATAALVLSGVPRWARFAVAEAEVTGYVQGLDQGTRLLSYDDPITVGGLPVYEVVREEGQVLLVTGYIGILDDDPAGLAFVPEGRPVGVGWEHIRGPWYMWVPLRYVSDDPD
jgi:hypothetical protein